MGQEISLLAVIEKIEKALGKKISVREEASKAGEQRRSCLSRDRAKDVLDWTPQFELEEGIRKTIEWAKGAQAL